MNRRATASTSAKRAAPKRARAVTSKRRIRKPATKKTLGAKRKTKAPPAKKAAPKRQTRAVAPGPSKAQNKRRPTPKKRKSQVTKPGLRARASRARLDVGAWLSRQEGLWRRARQVVVFVFGAAVVLWVGQETVRYARTAEAFAIREVIVDGNERLGPIDVRRAAGIQIGSNAFEVSMEDARDRLLQHPWVKDATVVRKLPNRVRVELVERRPVALVALDHLYLVSEEGAVFKRIGVDDPANLPVITGIASERFYDDLDYRKAVLLRSMAVLQDYEGAGLAKQEPVSEIHFDPAGGVELFVGEDGIHVRLGGGQHRQKLRRLKQVLTRLSREKARPAYVYLDNVRSPERVTVRLR
ncbi:MAG: FtsQ-type POTRA domain-containing protein [Polyangiales bacterium]